MIRFLFCLVGAAALAQVPPIPALRPMPVASSTTTTNANGDTVITVVIPRADPRRHYYGVMQGNETAYLGEMTRRDFERWAYAGQVSLGNQPEITRWTCIFSSTNLIAVNVEHTRLCPP